MGSLYSLAQAREKRGLPPACIRPAAVENDLHALLLHYDYQGKFQTPSASLRALAFQFCTQITRFLHNHVPTWARFHFYQSPFSPQLMAKLSCPAHKDSWWLLDKVSGKALPLATPAHSSSKLLLALPMSNFHRL